MKGLFAANLGAALIAGCAHMPSNAVSFFNLESCPQGWADIGESWQGRYVVMATAGTGRTVGTALSPGENRVTGDHGHSGSAVGVRANIDNQSADDDRGRYLEDLAIGSATPRNAGETVRPGTNAPYVELRACVKR